MTAVIFEKLHNFKAEEPSAYTRKDFYFRYRNGKEVAYLIEWGWEKCEGRLMPACMQTAAL